MLKNDCHTADVIAGYHINAGTNEPYLSPAIFETNSEEVQDIISKMPHWLIRQGTVILFAVVISLVAGSYFIHYPDVIVANVKITSSNPPVKVIAQANGRVQRIFVHNNQLIKKNESICLLQNPANYEDMILLKEILNRLDTALLLVQAIKTIPFAQYVQLGELQPGYTDLHQSVHQYLFFNDKNFVTQKVEQLQSQIGYQAELNKELLSRGILLKQQLILERNRFEADSFLVKEKVISRAEFNDRKKELITKQMNADATKSGILQNRLQQTEYLRTITDLHQQKLQQENDLQQKIRENVKRLQGQWDIWEQKYLTRSPVEGKVLFFNVWNENQYVTGGEAILMIVPPVQNYIAKASLPIDGAGKVKAGQKVLIRLVSYPFEEFGMVQGKVADISAVPLDTAYSMEIMLANGLITTTDKKIPSQAQFTGVAEVLTDDKNILDRLFEKIWNRNGR